MKQNAIEIIKCIPLGNSTMSRRIDEMAEDVEMQLVAKLQVIKFDLRIDESTLHNSDALLLKNLRQIY